MGKLAEIQDVLNGIWNPGNPETAKDAPKDFTDESKAIQDEVESEYGNVVQALSPQEQAAKQKALVDSIDKALTAIESRRSAALNQAKSPEHAVPLKAFAKELQFLGLVLGKWRAALVTMVDALNQNARTQFSDKGAWAIHFSVVRMTVTTFLVGICWSVMSLKWDEYNEDLGRAVKVLWVTAGIFLYIFTLMTSGASKKQKELKNLIPTSNTKGSAHKMRFRTWFSIWLPFFLFLGISWVAKGIHQKWSEPHLNKKINWTVMVQPVVTNQPAGTNYMFTNKVDGKEEVFRVVDVSGGSQSGPTTVTTKWEGPKDFDVWLTNVQKAVLEATNLAGIRQDLRGLFYVQTNIASLRMQMVRVQEELELLREKGTNMPGVNAGDLKSIETQLSNIVDAIKVLNNTVATNTNRNGNMNKGVFQIGPF